MASYKGLNLERESMNGKLILIIDDSKTQLIRLQMAFEKDGFDVITAGDGLEGVSRAIIDKPDIVISDIIMPELNGYQLCRLLKKEKNTSHLPIILLTSLDQKQDRFWGIRAGADQYMVKSSDLISLKEATIQLLKKTTNRSVDRGKPKPGDNKSTDWQLIKSSANHMLDKLLFESTLSSEAKLLANFINNKDDLFKEMTVLVNSLIDYTCLCLCLFEKKGPGFYFDLKQPVSEQEIKNIKEHFFTIITDNRKKESVETFFIHNSLKPDKESGVKILSRLIAPLNIHDECIGYLSFYSNKENAFSPESENIINLLAHDFSMVFQLMLLYDEIKVLSITDGLTTLSNKQYFIEILEKEFERAKRFKNDLSLIVMDIDYFKSVNDTYGHLQGDSVLKEIGSIIKENIRKVDFAARYGGEEFVVLAINTDIQDTKILAEKIRNSIECYSFKAEKQPLKLTASFGVSSVTNDTTSKLDIVKKADDALYQAKNGGRNRVCVSG